MHGRQSIARYVFCLTSHKEKRIINKNIRLWIKENFGKGYVDALGSLEKCLAKYRETGNTEYLLDAGNYAMFEYMYPQHEKAHFRATDSSESAGIVGLSVGEARRFEE